MEGIGGTIHHGPMMPTDGDPGSVADPLFNLGTSTTRSAALDLVHDEHCEVNNSGLREPNPREGDEQMDYYGSPVIDRLTYQTTSSPRLLQFKRLICAMEWLEEEMDINKFLSSYTPISISEHDPVSAPKPSKRSLLFHNRSSSMELERVDSFKHDLTRSSKKAHIGYQTLVKALVEYRKGHQTIRGVQQSLLDFKSDAVQALIAQDRLPCRQKFQLFRRRFVSQIREQSKFEILSAICEGSVPSHEKQDDYVELCKLIFRPLHESPLTSSVSHTLLEQTATSLVILRELEYHPMSTHVRGFVNKIDNLLAILIAIPDDGQFDVIPNRSASGQTEEPVSGRPRLFFTLDESLKLSMYTPSLFAAIAIALFISGISLLWSVSAQSYRLSQGNISSLQKGILTMVGADLIATGIDQVGIDMSIISSNLDCAQLLSPHTPLSDLHSYLSSQLDQSPSISTLYLLNGDGLTTGVHRPPQPDHDPVLFTAEPGRECVQVLIVSDPGQYFPSSLICDWPVLSYEEALRSWRHQGIGWTNVSSANPFISYISPWRYGNGFIIADLSLSLLNRMFISQQSPAGDIVVVDRHSDMLIASTMNELADVVGYPIPDIINGITIRDAVHPPQSDTSPRWSPTHLSVIAIPSLIEIGSSHTLLLIGISIVTGLTITLYLFTIIIDMVMMKRDSKRGRRHGSSSRSLGNSTLFMESNTGRDRPWASAMNSNKMRLGIRVIVSISPLIIWLIWTDIAIDNMKTQQDRIMDSLALETGNAIRYSLDSADHVMGLIEGVVNNRGRNTTNGDDDDGVDGILLSASAIWERDYGPIPYRSIYWRAVNGSIRGYSPLSPDPSQTIITPVSGSPGCYREQGLRSQQTIRTFCDQSPDHVRHQLDQPTHDILSTRFIDNGETRYFMTRSHSGKNENMIQPSTRDLNRSGSVFVEIGSSSIQDVLESTRARLSSSDLAMAVLEIGHDRHYQSANMIAASGWIGENSDPVQPDIDELIAFIKDKPDLLICDSQSVCNIIRDTLQPSSWANLQTNITSLYNWLIPVMVSRSLFNDIIDDNHTLTLIIAITITITFSLLSHSASRSLNSVKRVIRGRSGSTRSNLGSSLSIRTSFESDHFNTKRVKFKEYKDFKEAIERMVHGASAISLYRSQYISGDDGCPIPIHHHHQHVWNRARGHITDGRSGLNILHICLLEKLESGLPLRVYKLVQSRSVKLIITAITAIHIALSFCKPDTGDAMAIEGTSAMVIGAEGICLAIEFTSITARIFTKYIWVKDIVLVVLFTVVAIDWLIMTIYNMSIEYVIPCRALLYLLHSSGCRQTLRLILRTTISATSALTLYLYLVLTSGSICLVLFRSLINTNQIDSSFTNIVRSMTTCFVFVTTAENYSDIIYPAIGVDPLYGVFLFILVITGMFAVLGVFIARFYWAFDKQRQMKQAYDAVYGRAGIISAFILLDDDESNMISGSNLHLFLQYIRPDIVADELGAVVEDVIRLGFHQSSSQNKRPSVKKPHLPASPSSSPTAHSDLHHPRHISLEQFITIIERVLLLSNHIALRPVHHDFASILYENLYYNRLMKIVTILYITAISFYGIIDHSSQQTIDLICIAAVFGSSIEIAIKIYLYSPNRYWNYSSYRPGRWAEETEFVHRSDLCLLLIALIGTLIAFAINTTPFDYDQDRYGFRLFLVLPVIRLFTQTNSCRHLVHVVVKIIPAIKNLILVLILVVYIYGMIGVNLLSGQFNRLPSDQTPIATFDNLSGATLTLIQLLVSDNWHQVMYSSIRVHGWNITWYFLSYMLLINIIFTNLCLGIILSLFSKALN